MTGAKDVQTRIAFANGVFFRDFDISSSKQLVRMFAIKVSDFIVGSEFHDLDIEILKVLNQQLFPCITNKIHDGIVVASFTAIAFSARRIAAVLTEQMIVNRLLILLEGLMRERHTHSFIRGRRKQNRDVICCIIPACRGVHINIVGHRVETVRITNIADVFPVGILFVNQFFVRNERVKSRVLIVFLNRFFVVKTQVLFDQICHRVISRALEQELRTIEVIVRIASFT